MKTDFLLSTGASVSLYPADSIEQESYLIYLHGGGFVYGSRQDIPKPLIELFHEHNYTILSMDYLLAPNSSLSEIIAATWENFLELKSESNQGAPLSNLRSFSGRVFDDGIDEKNFC